MTKRYNEELVYSEIFDGYSVQMEEHSEGRWVEYADILNSIKAKPLVWEPYKVPNPKVIVEGSTCLKYTAYAGGAWGFMGDMTYGQGDMDTAKAAAEAHHQEAFKANIMIGETK